MSKTNEPVQDDKASYVEVPAKTLQLVKHCQPESTEDLYNMHNFKGVHLKEARTDGTEKAWRVFWS